jgi:hypothetical protein
MLKELTGDSMCAYAVIITTPALSMALRGNRSANNIFSTKAAGNEENRLFMN